MSITTMNRHAMNIQAQRVSAQQMMNIMTEKHKVHHMNDKRIHNSEIITCIKNMVNSHVENKKITKPIYIITCIE